ncbi:G-protein beta wd-40 repeats containing [Metarhizium brunneum]
MKILDDPNLYTIGWIAALPIERASATALLDERHGSPQGFEQHQCDTNSYTWGRVGEHNIVIASLPAGMYGTISAATTASNLLSSLPQIRIGLLVGIGGAVARPDRDQDIRLGDVVVSQPDGTEGGVVQYDLGNVALDGSWQRKGSLNMPPPVLLRALANLQAEHEISQSKVPDLLQAMWLANPQMTRPKNKAPAFVHQGFENDRLFVSTYDHAGGSTCSLCDASKEVQRDQRDTTEPDIHYGVIASGNKLIKDAATRDKIADVLGKECICFEMEAAGLMNHFPCLVIRGICDYTDSHKNDQWQRYASATAAAYTKELLGFVPTKHLQATQRAIDTLKSIGEDIKNIQSVTAGVKEIAQGLHTAIREIDEKTVFDRLPIVAGASFDSHDEECNPTCLPDTRIELIKQIMEWADNPCAVPVFWLNGMAGTGKSTISRTIARSFAQTGHLGASFFFKRGEGDRGNSSKLFTTVAAHLAARQLTVAPHIKNVIDADFFIGHRGLEEQFDKLIMQPLVAASQRSRPTDSIVIVVDALDECEADDKEVKLIVHLMGCAKSLGLRTFVSSRPELPIRLGFQAMKGQYQGVILHEIPEPVVERDLQLFLEHELATIRSEYNILVPEDRQLPVNWPGRSNLRSLVHMATPLFLFAATVCRFLADRRCGSPEEKLQEVLRYRTRSQESQLDATYLPVLDRIVVGLSLKERDKALQQFRTIVGSIVILATPLSTNAISSILSVAQGTIDSQLGMLHSVLSVPSSAKSPVRLLHLSFRDFLMDPAKRGKHLFWVDEKFVHGQMATNCVRIMSKYLRSDICNIAKPGTCRAAIGNQYVDRHIPPEVQYACLYWTYHLQQCKAVIDDGGQSYKFLERHFLHWVEVLSYIGRVSESLSLIQVLQRLLSLQSIQVAELLRDATRWILANLSIIDSNPLQIYSSALAFAPRNSVVRKMLAHQMPKWISLAPEPEDKWDQCQQILEGHMDTVTSIAFSPDSTLLASASVDHTLRLWQINSGECLQKLTAHSCPVTSVAFSPDSILLASASYDSTIRLWQVNSGECIQELKGHVGGITSVAFSPDSIILASASSDCTIRLWRVNSGESIRELKGHIDDVTSVTFSPESALLASASYDRTIRLWQANSGKSIQELKGHSRAVMSVAFSPNSALLASASYDRIIRLWKVSSGNCIQELTGHGFGVTSANFSANSTLLASASGDRTIRLWQVDSGECIQELKGHGQQVTSVEFSPDSKLLASASGDRTIRLWQVDSGECIQELKGHSREVLSVTFSPDSTLLASTSYDRTIRLWQVNSGAYIREFHGRGLGETVVAFSPDSKLLASDSGDRTVRLWQVNSGECIQELRGHIRSIMSVAFSPNLKFLASASCDCTIRLWHVDSGECIQELKGHSREVTSVAFSPDSTLLVSASKDNTVRLWQVDSNECIQIYTGIRCRLLQFDPCNARIVTDVGSFSIPSQIPTGNNATPATPFSPSGVGISDCWVIWQQSNLLWLPAAFRPGCSAVSGSTVAIGSNSGRVIIMTFCESQIAGLARDAAKVDYLWKAQAGPCT